MEMTLKVLKIPVRSLLHCKQVMTAGERLLTLNYHQNDAARVNPTILYAQGLISLAGMYSITKIFDVYLGKNTFDVQRPFVLSEQTPKCTVE